MLSSYKRLIKTVSSQEHLFLLVISGFALISIPVIVFAIVNSRDYRTMAAHQECFDLNGDFKVTQSDLDLIVDRLGLSWTHSGYVAAYDIDHSGYITLQDVAIEGYHFNEVCAPKISFSANRTTINQGDSVKFSWNVKYTWAVNLSPGVGWVGASGSKYVYPSSTTTYTLHAGNKWTTSKKTITITVRNPTSTPPPSGSSPPPPGGSSGSSGPGGSSGSTSSNIVETFKLKITVPYLIGKVKIPVKIGGKSKGVVVSGGTREYKVSVLKEKFELGKKISVVVDGDKMIAKKFSVTPKNKVQSLNIGKLFLGDINEDNRIDDKDKSLLTESISSQTQIGDLNMDEVSNSLDWAILLTNFGKKGSK